MSDFNALRILDFDHIEFAVADLEKSAQLYFRMGFEQVGLRELPARKLRSILLASNQIRILLSHSEDGNDPVGRYVKTHGDGVITVGFTCEDALHTFETVVGRGAQVIQAPRSFSNEFGGVQEASIAAIGDVQHRFVSRTGSLFAEGFNTPTRVRTNGYGLQRIDHITNNVEAGKRDEWVKFYERLFGLRDTRFFDIKTQRTGLYSTVLQSPNGTIKMPVNEPTGTSSQIQEFIDVHHGPGVQHIALATGDIMSSLRQLRKEGLKFLEVPSTYYEAIPKRVPNVSEDLRELEELGILVDGSPKGYLLQIFTHNVIGPFFYEVIQRKGDDGFGEGNFTALFEAIERDQIRRGVLKA